MALSRKNVKDEPTAEISTLGSYAKGWFRQDGKPWLYKTYGTKKMKWNEKCVHLILSIVLMCMGI